MTTRDVQLNRPDPHTSLRAAVAGLDAGRAARAVSGSIALEIEIDGAGQVRGRVGGPPGVWIGELEASADDPCPWIIQNFGQRVGG